MALQDYVKYLDDTTKKVSPKDVRDGFAKVLFDDYWCSPPMTGPTGAIFQ